MRLRKGYLYITAKCATCTDSVMLCMKQVEKFYWDLKRFVEESNISLLYAEDAALDLSTVGVYDRADATLITDDIEGE